MGGRAVGRGVLDGMGVIVGVLVGNGVGVADGVIVGVVVAVGVLVPVGVHVGGRPRVGVPVGKGGLKGLMAIWGFTEMTRKAAIATTVNPKTTNAPI